MEKIFATFNKPSLWSLIWTKFDCIQFTSEHFLELWTSSSLMYKEVGYFASKFGKRQPKAMQQTLNVFEFLWIFINCRQAFYHHTRRVVVPFTHFRPKILFLISVFKKISLSFIQRIYTTEFLPAFLSFIANGSLWTFKNLEKSLYFSTFLEQPIHIEIIEFSDYIEYKFVLYNLRRKPCWSRQLC